MHLVKDENGNVLSHEHHSHAHTHTYEHTHEHAHLEGHEEEHCHTHGEEHTSEEEGSQKTAALLQYMHDHNVHHAKELSGMAEKLEAAKMEEAAEEIRKAVTDFMEGNRHLAAAIKAARE